nr:AMP-binding protein [Chlamydiota bacterium]
GGLTLKQRLRALSLSRKSPEAILRAFNYSGKKDDPCVILFTSGTESFPKGVPLSNGNVMDNQRAASQRISLKASDVIVGVLPPFHSFGFSVTGMLPLLGGFRVAYSPNPTNGRQIAYTTEHWRGTLFCSAPTFLKTLLRVSNKAQMRTMRLIITGAERLPDELIEQMHKLNPKTSLIEGYGITECAPILTLNEPGKPCVGVGKAIPNVDIRILHPESMSVVSLGETGLIVARGPNVFDGYLSDERSPFVEFEGKRWYDTGDLGHLDGEGNLTIDGRLKRFVKIGGEMISLSMIEEILAGEAEKRGWKVAKDAPSFATIATETGESKSAIHLFTVCELSTDEVNSALKEAGVSNLIKVQSVNHLYTMPLLGSGKVDFRTLKSKLKVAR